MTIVQRKNKPSTNSCAGAASSDHHHHHVCEPSIAAINNGVSLQLIKSTSAGIEHSTTNTTKNRMSAFMVIMVVSLFISMMVTLLVVCIFSINLFLGKATENYNMMNSDWDRDKAKDKPRLVYLSIKWMNDQDSSLFTTDPILHVTAGEEGIEQPDEAGSHDQSNCVPMASWQTQSYPTCNTVHEINMGEFGYYPLLQSRIGDKRIQVGSYNLIADAVPYSYTNVKFMGKGWYRQTWKVDSFMENFVLKTLRFDRDFLREYYESHRKDAIASERLSSSPYVIDIYGFCAQSVINEYVAFKEGISKLKDFILHVNKFKGKNILKLKLKIALMIAQGVQHIHEIDGPNATSLVHYDLNPSNVLITAKGIPKINDFNVAHFFYWDTLKQDRCPFVGYLTSQPWWRAPEEMAERPSIDEKVDIYSLGNILFNIVVGHSPRRPSRNETGWIEKVRTDVEAGIPPSLSHDHAFSREPEIVAIVEAINRCYQADPINRGPARDIVSVLEKAAYHA